MFFLELVKGLLMVCWESSSQADTVSVSEEDQFFESQSLVAQNLGKTFSILMYFNQIWYPAYLVLHRIPFLNMLLVFSLTNNLTNTLSLHYSPIMFHLYGQKHLDVFLGCVDPVLGQISDTWGREALSVAESSHTPSCSSLQKCKWIREFRKEEVGVYTTTV